MNKQPTKKAHWQKVEKPIIWRPEEGETIEGFYGGLREKVGMYGTFQSLVLLTKNGLVLISGQVIINLVENAGVLTPKTQLRVAFLGLKEGNEHEYKDFELYVKRGG